MVDKELAVQLKRLYVTPGKCIGCRTCELSCTFVHSTEGGKLRRSRVKVHDTGDETFIPVLCLDYFIGVVGGLYLGLRKQFHPKMKDIETDTSKSFIIKGIIDARFEKTSTDRTRELDPFFVEIFEHPTVTVSYLNRTFFYTTRAYPTKVLDASNTYEWHYKGSVIKSSENTFANYAEYNFTTSQAMRYKAYFYPKYTVK